MDNTNTTNTGAITTLATVDATTAALVAFLRAEADLSEQKAISLRAQADQLAALYDITPDLQARYDLDPSQLPPLDEHGIPKYKGKKRGRKPKERKRKANPNRRKRQHTAYTLFVQQVYPGVKASHPDWPSKDVISIVAKQWAEVPPEEKRVWKERAIQTHEQEEDEDDDDEEEERQGMMSNTTTADDAAAQLEATAAAAVAGGFGDDDEEEEEEEVEEEDEDVEEEEEDDEDMHGPVTRRRRK